MSIKSTLVTSAAALAIAGGVALAVPAAASGGAPTVAPSSSNGPAASATPAVLASASTGTSTASTAQTCDVNRDDRWPLYATGRPKGLDAGDAGGVYLWHDDDGWHLRVTHSNDHVQVYSGTIATAGEIRFQRVLDERGDRAWVGPDHHELHFVFTNFGHLDGVDFQTRCAPRLGFALQGDGHALPASRVNIGYFSTHPANVPFQIARIG